MKINVGLHVTPHDKNKSEHSMSLSHFLIPEIVTDLRQLDSL
jgi:hypothetical protein